MEIVIKRSVQQEGSPIEFLMIMGCACCSEGCKVISIAIVSYCLVSLASTLSVVVAVEGCFMCGMGRVFTKVKCASCMWLCVT